MPPSIDQIIDRLDSYPPGTTLNVKEIATILELPWDTVAARLNRDRQVYARYLSKKAHGNRTMEYRLDREAIVNMINDPRYRGSHKVNNLKPKSKPVLIQSDSFDKTIGMIRSWNSNEVSIELLERIPKMKYEVGTWYPMHLAPKDGTRIIVCDSNNEVLMVEWGWSGCGHESNQSWWDWCIIYAMYISDNVKAWTVPNPTKWMPCPLP